MYASLKWLEQFDVLTQDDLIKLEKLKSIRNSLAHNLSLLVTAGEDFDHVNAFNDAVELIHKVEKWWILNVEIPTNPDFDNQEIDEDEIVCGPVLSLQLCSRFFQEMKSYYKFTNKIKK
ncbi:MAG: hypothetical protein H0W85_07250 [Methylotenera sp.]|nr:hypothetical protein [Methylotenera sp.]